MLILSRHGAFLESITLIIFGPIKKSEVVSHLNLCHLREIIYDIFLYNRRIVKDQWSAHFNDLSYLRTPPLGQDMTQGQFLSRV